MTRFLLPVLVIAGGAVFQAGSAKPNADEQSQRDRNPPASRPAAQRNPVNDKMGRQIDMRSKLAMVQKIVEGISTEDFETIEAGATELATLAESAAWKSSRDPYYRHYSANFEQAARGLIDAAKRESVEKSTFAYVHATFACTACHQHVRGTIRTAR